MLYQRARWGVLILLVLILAACNGAAEVPAAEQPALNDGDGGEVAPAENSGDQADQPLPTAPGVPTATTVPPPTAETVAEVTEAPPAEEEPPTEAPPAEIITAAHRAAPAPPEQFVADAGTWVGNTGRPQLVEFFAYW